MSSGGTTGPRGTGGTRAGGGAGGAGGAGVASSERQGDGSLTVTPDSPADAEWRARRGPLDGVGEITGPWGEEDSTGMFHDTTSPSHRASRAVAGTDGRRESRFTCRRLATSRRRRKIVKRLLKPG
jgi:hypothetical protein